MSDTPSEQPEIRPAVYPEFVPVRYSPYSEFLYDHGLALLALAFAIAGCVLGGLALSRSDHPHRWTCPPAIYGAVPGHAMYGYPRQWCWNEQPMPAQPIEPGTGGGFGGIAPRIKPLPPGIQPHVQPMPPFVNPGGKMIPAPAPTQP